MAKMAANTANSARTTTINTGTPASDTGPATIKPGIDDSAENITAQNPTNAARRLPSQI